jgi:hypothetical protein
MYCCQAVGAGWLPFSAVGVCTDAPERGSLAGAGYVFGCCASQAVLQAWPYCARSLMTMLEDEMVGEACRMFAATVSLL